MNITNVFYKIDKTKPENNKIDEVHSQSNAEDEPNAERIAFIKILTLLNY